MRGRYQERDALVRGHRIELRTSAVHRLAPSRSLSREPPKQLVAVRVNVAGSHFSKSEKIRFSSRRKGLMAERKRKSASHTPPTITDVARRAGVSRTAVS